MPSTASRSSCPSGRKKTGRTEARNGCIRKQGRGARDEGERRDMSELLPLPMRSRRARPRLVLAPRPSPLIDSFGRVHNNLRISVTDRCNLRCTYCMPEEVVFMDRAELLTFEEISPLRPRGRPSGDRQDPSDRRRAADAPRPARGWCGCSWTIPGIRDIGLTTNGMLLADQAQALFDAGLRRINISLDTLDPRALPASGPPRRAGQGAGRHRRREEGGLSPDQDQRRQHSRRHRGRSRAAGPLRARTRSGDALHRVHADRRRALGARQGLLRPRNPGADSSRRVCPLVPADDYDPRAPAMDFATPTAAARSASSPRCPGRSA